MLKLLKKFSWLIALIKKIPGLFFALKWFVVHVLYPSGLFDNFILNNKKMLTDDWEERIKEVIICPDNNDIPRVTNAGQVEKGKQIMHNGLKINLGSYYGPEFVQMFYRNKGVHEPQEEKIFQEVLKVIPNGGTMIEMGAFWSFYSMWFNKDVKNANNYMIEPDKVNLKCGTNNFKLNNMKGHFTHGFIGKESSNLEGTPMICIDDFVKEKEIKHIDILHSDIQGFEHDMLLGSEKTIASNKVSFIFVSTHTSPKGVHQKCIDFLKNHNYPIIVDVDLDNTFSADGLIVAHSPQVTWNKDVKISQKQNIQLASQL